MKEQDLFSEIEALLLGGGAQLVGCADLSPLPQKVRHRMPGGISIGVALAPDIVSEIASGPTRQYAEEYNRTNRHLNLLSETCARFLKRHGYRAFASKSTVLHLDYQRLSTALPHKSVATLAGLGWIGRSALLVNETFGSAVRYNTVLTDAPLVFAEPVTASRCGDCRECVDACPAGAPSGKLWQQQMQREDFFDAFKCMAYASKVSGKIQVRQTICGICIRACPYTIEYITRACGQGEVAGKGHRTQT